MCQISLSRLILICFSCLCLPQTVFAKNSDVVFEQLLDDVCNVVIPLPVTTPDVINMCTLAFPPPAGGPPIVTTVNSGSSSAQTGLLIKQAKDAIDDRLDEIKDEQGDGASFDVSNIGFLLAVQASKSDRLDTELESGYDSDLAGITVGLDYLFGESFVLGASASLAKSDGDFVAGSGGFDNESLSLIVYGTWLALDSLSVDFYLGSSQTDYQSSRRVVMGDIDGTSFSDYDGDQTLNGASVNYDLPIGDWSFGAYAALDSIKTDIDAYTETGGTLLELAYPAQNFESSTITLGLRGSYVFGYDWGVLVPSVDFSVVDENENDKRFTATSLAIIPPEDQFSPTDVQFIIETDDPDRKFSYLSFSLVASANSGEQYFLNLSQLAGHQFLDEIAISIGMLTSF